MRHAPSEQAAGPPVSTQQRILLITPAGLGGTVQYTHNLANALVQAGHDVMVATAIDNDISDLRRSYRLVGVFDRFKPHLDRLRTFRRAVREFDPQIVHFQGAQRPEFNLLVWGALRCLTRARFVWTPQDVVSNSVKPYHRRLLRFLYRRMAHVYLNAQQNVASFCALFGYAEDQITVLPIPDPVAFARTDHATTQPAELTLECVRPLLLSFGLIEERKDIGSLIVAFTRFVAQGGQANLLIMGKALCDVAPYRQAIAQSGLPPDRVQMIVRYASYEEMNWLFETATAVVLSYNKGWNSGVLATAQGYGVPVITTRIGGFAEVVQDGVSGLVVPASDPAALSDAMLRLTEDKDLRDTLAGGAAEAGRVSSWAQLAAQTAKVNARLLLLQQDGVAAP